MAFFTLAFLAALVSSLVSAGPVALNNATLLANGQQAQILNSEFEYLQVNDSCNSARFHLSWPVESPLITEIDSWRVRLYQQGLRSLYRQRVGDTAMSLEEIMLRPSSSPDQRHCMCVPIIPHNHISQNVPIWVVCRLHKSGKCCLNN